MPENQIVPLTRTQQPMVYGAQDIVATIRRIDEVMKAVMRKDEHYGVIPGTQGKPTLLKSGAEKLCETFRLAPLCPKEDQAVESLGGDHRNYQLTVTLKHIVTGQVWSQGVGSCSTKESKYRWRRAGRTCPKCNVKDSIIKGKEEYGGGWLCWTKKGGCGAKWADGTAEIESQKEEKIENTDPADVWNTCLKMAYKRAFVAATLSATAASDIFTQDVEDLPSVQQAATQAPQRAPVTPVGEPIDPQTGEVLSSPPPWALESPVDQAAYQQPALLHPGPALLHPGPAPQAPPPPTPVAQAGQGAQPQMTGSATYSSAPPVPTSQHGSDPAVYPGNVQWTFGKHKGQSLWQLPTQYLEWAIGWLETVIEDPAKQQYREKNQAAITAARDELAARTQPQPVAIGQSEIKDSDMPW